MTQYIKQILFLPSVARIIVRLLARMHQFSYDYVGPFAIAAERGLHPKHRLMNYHKFFVDNVSVGDRVLDIGCGNGALLKSIAGKTGAEAVGVETSELNAMAATKALSDFPDVKIIHSDIWLYNEPGTFDVVILSNVLEHIDKRTELLQFINAGFTPEKVLIRVPMFEREWLVPYKKELGMEWRLDPTHHIEYTESELRQELDPAGMDIQSLKIQWGEIYAVVKPLKQPPG